jgi:uncharacterized cupin superfamily protein
MIDRLYRLFTGKPRYRFGKYADLCHKAMREAKVKARESGIRYSEVAISLEVKAVPGEKYFPTGWGWKSKLHDGMYVLGLTHNDNRRWVVEAGVAPNTRGDMRHDVLVHEFCHYLLGQARIHHHDPRIVGVFGWSEGAML